MLARFARSGSQSHLPLKNPRSANVVTVLSRIDKIMLFLNLVQFG